MTAWAYYNEFDPHAAAWLRNLISMGAIAPGEVDERDIRTVDPDDLRGFTQCHFFAGIGVWSYSLRCAGIADEEPVWTGSCPCQGFSAAGLQRGFDDERHLWPDWFRLIDARRPRLIWGEQVASALIIGKTRNKKSEFGPYGLYEPDRETQIPTAWLDLVLADMEGARYAMGVRAAPAAGVGSPQIRLRTFFVAHRLEHAEGDGRLERGPEPGERSLGGRRGAEWLEDTERARLEGFARHGRRGSGRPDQVGPVAEGSESGRLADGIGDGRRARRNGDHRGDVRSQLDADGRHDRRMARSDGGNARSERQQRSGEHGQLASDGGPVRLAVSERFGRNEGIARNAGNEEGARGEDWHVDDRRSTFSRMAGTPAEGREERRGYEAKGSRQSEFRSGHVDTVERLTDAGRRQLPVQIGRPERGNGAGSDRPHLERAPGRAGPVDGFWRDSDWVFCRDGRWRPIEPGTFPLVDGTSFRVGSGSPFEGKSRQEMLRGYGNAIVSEAAISFIEDYLEATGRIVDADASLSAPARSSLTLALTRKRDLEDLI